MNKTRVIRFRADEFQEKFISKLKRDYNCNQSEAIRFAISICQMYFKQLDEQENLKKELFTYFVPQKFKKKQCLKVNGDKNVRRNKT